MQKEKELTKVKIDSKNLHSKFSCVDWRFLSNLSALIKQRSHDNELQSRVKSVQPLKRGDMFFAIKTGFVTRWVH